MNGNVGSQQIQNAEFLEAMATSIESVDPMSILTMCLPVFVVAFLVTLLVTPLYRRLAFALDVVDRPDDARKIHTRTTPYLGGLAVATGLLVGLLVSYPLSEQWPVGYRMVPIWIVVGMLIICLTGFLDDLTEFDSWIKVSGMLVAAAGLAVSNVGTRVAAGLLDWLFGIEQLYWTIPLIELNMDVTDLIGGGIIGIFVLGGCNATNLIDGLDGLLTGVTAIVAIGLLALSLVLVDYIMPIDVLRLQQSIGTPAQAFDEGVTLAGARVVLCLALLGATLGFLPHNFNPATIFLGDCGSLLLGYVCVVIILMLGEAGQTHLVLAGLIVFSIPIIDTLLAIVRRRIQGKSFWDPDAKHLHHILKRRMGGVKSAVLSLYGLGAFFAVLGAGLGILHLLGHVRVLLIYIVFIVIMLLTAGLGWKMGRDEQKADA
jgi:UDP-GlcNAc:undecaprenyl-phosphate GlcNAc-1-phosphate transferase